MQPQRVGVFPCAGPSTTVHLSQVTQAPSSTGQRGPSLPSRAQVTGSCPPAPGFEAWQAKMGTLWESPREMGGSLWKSMMRSSSSSGS